MANRPAMRTLANAHPLRLVYRPRLVDLHHADQPAHRPAFIGLAALVVFAACGSPGTSSDHPEAAALAAAVHHLVTESNTFGPSHQFSEILVWNHYDRAGGSTGRWSVQPGRVLTATIQSAIKDSLNGLGPIRWINNPRQWITDDLRPVIEGAAIVSVGETTLDGDEALVPVLLWCGGTCGFGTTFQLSLMDGNWVVTGNQGGVFIS